MPAGLVFVIIIAVVLALAISAIMFLTRGRGGVLNREQYQAAWLKIENSIQRSNINSYRLAIFDADSLLDKALKESGVTGETMGERLKNANANFSNINQVWTAHKLRNHLAHNADARVNEIALRHAVAIFKKSLRELGAI